MIYKNIDIHNCREILKNDETGLYMMSRIPVELNDKIEGNAFQNSGVELRFVPNDDEIKIVLRTQKKIARCVQSYTSARFSRVGNSFIRQ